MRKILKWVPLFFLIVSSFFTRFFLLSHPSKVVFDEAHFGLYATKYLSHQYYFDIHPPLGKLILALSAFLGKIKPGFDFALNSEYPDFNFFALRFLPALFGSLLVILVYFLVKKIGFSQKIAFLAAFLVLFDNAFLVQSRFILLDIILIFFIFLALYLFFFQKKYSLFSKKWYFFNLLSGLALAAAISIKWTGFGTLGIIWFLTIFEDRLFSQTKKEILTKISLLFIVPLLFYFIFFAIHFSLLPLACSSDCGAVLEPYLERPYFINPPSGNIFSKFIEVNKLILASHFSSGGGISHYYQSDWWSWPFMIRPIKYFSETQNDKTSFIYFLGNPLVWWLGIIGILGYLYLLTKNYFYKFKLKLPSIFYSKASYFLFLGYLVYFLPFLAIKRFMLIYHYLPALLFSIILFSIFLEGLSKMIFKSSVKANILFFGILILVLISFIYFLPLSYGLSLTESAFQSRIWLPSWGF